MAKKTMGKQGALRDDDFIQPLQGLQEHWMSQLQQSMDTTFHSWMRITEFAGEAVDVATRHQVQAMDLVINPYFNHIGMLHDLFDQPNLQPRLGQHVAVVTGGIGGIGTAICRCLADDDNYVIATYIPAETEQARAWQREQRAAGYNIGIVECDVTDYASCEAMAREIETEAGRIDILVNGAGITRDATLRKMEPDTWHAVLDTNLDSVFNVTRNVIDIMAKHDYGRVINIASVNGQKGQFGQTNYSAAKAGMIGFTKALALELADSGITVNTISPGYIATRMVEAIPDEVKQQIIAKIPVGRLGKPEEIAAAVAYLAREDSGYITGSDLSINGGLYIGYK